jgi:hypothetical protein
LNFGVVKVFKYGTGTGATYSGVGATYSGVGAITVIAKVLVAELVAFVAVTVYINDVAAVVGVPEIKPVLVLNTSPGVFEIVGEIE